MTVEGIVALCIAHGVRPPEALVLTLRDEIRCRVEEERAACVEILNEEIADMDGLASHSQKVHHYETMSGARMSAKGLRKCAEKIRARSTKTIGDKQ